MLPWFRSILVLQPDAALMSAVPSSFKVRILAGMLLFALFPFTRLVHALGGFAVVRYLFRPYIVYRSRDPRTRARPGREPVGLPQQRRGRHDSHRTRSRHQARS